MSHVFSRLHGLYVFLRLQEVTSFPALTLQRVTCLLVHATRYVFPRFQQVIRISAFATSYRFPAAFAQVVFPRLSRALLFDGA